MQTTEQQACCQMNSLRYSVIVEEYGHRMTTTCLSRPHAVKLRDLVREQAERDGTRDVRVWIAREVGGETWGYRVLVE